MGVPVGWPIFAGPNVHFSSPVNAPAADCWVKGKKQASAIGYQLERLQVFGKAWRTAKVKWVGAAAGRRRPDWAGSKAGKARRSAAYWMYVSIRGPQPNTGDGPGPGGALTKEGGLTLWKSSGRSPEGMDGTRQDRGKARRKRGTGSRKMVGVRACPLFRGKRECVFPRACESQPGAPCGRGSDRGSPFSRMTIARHLEQRNAGTPHHTAKNTGTGTSPLRVA